MSRFKLAGAVAAVIALAAWLWTGAAAALPGPTTLSAGFVDEALVFDAGQMAEWFPRMHQLGSSWVRIPALWNVIAPVKPPPGFRPANPADPSYNWTYLDGAVRAASAARQQIVLTVETAPSWALGRGAPSGTQPGTWRPSPSAYGTFARALAQRYAGRFPDPQRPGHALPPVRYFQAWNEPNLSAHLTPQWTHTRHGYAPVSPVIYRRLLNAFYANVKAVQRRAYVLAAGLAPYGDSAGGSRMHPVSFFRELLCLSGPRLRPEKCPVPAHFDAADIHPYSLTPTVHAANPDDVSVPDVGRLSHVLRAAEREHRALPRGRKAIWETEIDWDSSPPDPSGFPLTKQAHYLALAFYQAWRQGISHILWYEARDLGPGAKSFYGGGLFFSGGRAKPSATAFRFPFVAVRDRGGAVTLWGRAPRPGSVTIEVDRKRGWRRLARLGTTQGGVFYARRRIASHLTLRARVGTIVSSPYTS